MHYINKSAGKSNWDKMEASPVDEGSKCDYEDGYRDYG